MLTYSFQDKGKESLYEFLYKKIREDIVSRRLSPDEKLPSKRALAKNLNISTVTVETAYSQLMAEGYIYSVPKSGFYVSHITPGTENKKSPASSNTPAEKSTDKTIFFADFTANYVPSGSFPFVTWTRLMRETMSDSPEKLTVNSPSEGIPELRSAIADYLFQFRGMTVSPEKIIVGAGTEYLYGLIIQLLGRNKTYAIEEPGYQKIGKIYRCNDVSCVHIPLDSNGIDVSCLDSYGAEVVHISPSHHFPTGIVTPISRRYDLLSWAAAETDRYIIEDDYDSEFRLLGKPVPSLQSIDTSGKVIYINTFSKSLTSTIRISYMVLPERLSEKYKQSLGFYSCTVPNFEQYTLAKFIRRGFFEKHINRMRTHYRSQRDNVMSCIANHRDFSKVKITEENSGLHFLLTVDTKLSDAELKKKAAEKGIKISCMSEYCHDKSKAVPHTLVINYSGLPAEKTQKAIELLFECF